MKVNDLVKLLNCKVVNEGNHISDEVTGGYTSDLLSDVMGNIEEGMIWITLQTHRNVVAVASLREVAAIVLIGGVVLETDALDQAVSECITVLSSPLPAFEASGIAYAALR